jgi:UDP-N-acetylmuramoyl-L-alanyl-D-glutamate--2,6-diaminopimelate ligase
LIVPVNSKEFKFISDDTNELTKNSAFLLNDINRKYLKIAKQKTSIILKTNDLKKYLKSNIKIIGITGTNGKTTVGSILSYTLSKLGKKIAFQGTMGFFINDKEIKGKSLTTPMPLDIHYNIHKACEHKCDFFIMEVSSHAIAQNRIEALRFDLKIHTNITRDHIDFHKSIDNYINVKNSFFADETKKIINIDDKIIKFNPKNAITYSIKNNANTQAINICLDENIKSDIKFNKEKEYINSKLYGKFNLYNILAVISSIKALIDTPLLDITKIINNFMGIKGRMEVVSINPLIIIDFAHTPDGMEQIFQSFKNKNIAVVFGAGGDRDKEKRALMGEIANKYANTIYITRDNPRSEKQENISKDILKGIQKKAIIIHDRKKALKEAIANLKDDVLLILGKGDEKYQEIDGNFIEFSDEEVVVSIVQQ